MLRTKAVKLTVIPAMAFRVKLPDGPSITIQRADTRQPGIASISKTSGDPIISSNTDLKAYPPEAFKEAMILTNGLPYKRQKGIKVDKAMFKNKKEEVIEEITFEQIDLQKIIETYSDKTGKFSYDLLNKDLIRFAKRSTVVKDMIAENRSSAKIRDYIVCHKFRNISENHDLSEKQVKKMTEHLDEIYGKGIYKELNSEIRKMLAANKKL